MTTLPTTSPWFTQTQISESLVAIRQPYVHRLVDSTIWHLSGQDRDLVVDMGLGVGSLRGELPQLFRRDHVAVITHSHLDHSGGASEFDRCIAHSSFQLDQAHATLFGAGLASDLGESGEALGPWPELLISALPHAAYDPASYRVEPPARLEAVQDGDCIDLGDRTFTVLHLPGHTADSIGLFDEYNGDFFSGDFIYDGVLIDTLADSDIESYVASMRRVLELRPKVTFPGHGPVLSSETLRDLMHEYIRLKG